jgi:hypothetical protein
VRWRIVALLAFVAGLTYIDRLNLGILAKYIQEEFQLPTQTMGWILGAWVMRGSTFPADGWLTVSDHVAFWRRQFSGFQRLPQRRRWPRLSCS